MSHYSSIKTAWSESFGMQTLLCHHPNLEIAHMKLHLTTWLTRTVCYLSYETCLISSVVLKLSWAVAPF